MKKLVTYLLSFLIIFTLIPGAALAEETEEKVTGIIVDDQQGELIPSSDFSEEDFTFNLDGVKYEFPLKFANLAENGWKLEDAQKIPPRSYMDMIAVKDGMKIRVGLQATADEPMEAEQAYVLNVGIRQGEFPQDLPLSEALNLSLSADDKTFQENLGDPVHENETEEGREVLYATDYATISISYDPEGILQKISMFHYESFELARMEMTEISPLKAEVKLAEEGELSDDLYDFQFQVDGQALTLLQPVEELKKLGFTPVYDSDEQTIDIWDTLGTRFQGPEGTGFDVVLMNMTEDPIRGSESVLQQVSFSRQEDGMPPFRLSRGITGESSLADVESAYGPATIKEDYGDLIQLTYGFWMDEYKFNFNPDGQMMFLDISRWGELVHYEPDEASLEAPEEIKVSENPDDFVFELDGTMMKLPMSVSNLLQNGWTIRYAPMDRVFPQSISVDFFFEKDNQFLRVMLENDSDELVPFEQLKVTGIGPVASKPDVVTAAFPMTVLGKLVLGESAPDDVRELFPAEMVSELEQEGIVTLSVSGWNDMAVYNFTFEDDVLSEIQIAIYSLKQFLGEQ